MGDRGSVRYSRNSLAEPSPLVQTQPALTKRAQTHFPKWVLQLAHKVNLKLCKVAPEIHPFLRVLTSNTVDPHEVMWELSYCGKQSPVLKLDALKDLNDFQLYRLYKTLKSNNAIYEILEHYVNELSDFGSGDDREQALIFSLTRMRTNINVLWGELCELLGNHGFSVSQERDKADPEVQEALKSSLAKIYGIVLAEDYKAMQANFKKTGEIDRGMMLTLLQDAYKRLGFNDRDGTIEDTLNSFMIAGTDTRRGFLSAVLGIVRDLRHPDPKGRYLDAQRKLFERSGSDDIFRVEYLPAIQVAASAEWAMHDMARQFASVKELKELKEAVKKELRICRVDKSVAQNFKELADQCAVEGRSAIVREAIGEYATEPTRERPKTWS
jgi:hypothetical protein